MATPASSLVPGNAPMPGTFSFGRVPSTSSEGRDVLLTLARSASATPETGVAFESAGKEMQSYFDCIKQTKQYVYSVDLSQ